MECSAELSDDRFRELSCATDGKFQPEVFVESPLVEPILQRTKVSYLIFTAGVPIISIDL